eukprot:403340128
MGSQQGKNKTQILITGLDNSGKSTIIPHLKPKKYRKKVLCENIEQQSNAIQSQNPTSTLIAHGNDQNFQVGSQENSIKFETFAKGRLGGNFTVFDLKSHNTRHRSLMETFYQEANAIVFVIDASDRLRMQVVKNELEMLLDHQDFKGKDQPILFLANKIDKPLALDEPTIIKTLNLDSLMGTRTWILRSCSALRNEGIFDAFLWLHKTMKEQKRQLQRRKDSSQNRNSIGALTCGSARGRTNSVGRQTMKSTNSQPTLLTESEKMQSKNSNSPNTSKNTNYTIITESKIKSQPRSLSKPKSPGRIQLQNVKKVRN